MSIVAIFLSIGSIYVTFLTFKVNVAHRKAMNITQGLIDSNSKRHPLGPNWKAVKEAEKILADNIVYSDCSEDEEFYRKLKEKEGKGAHKQ